MSHHRSTRQRVSRPRQSWGRHFALAVVVACSCGGCWQEIRYEPDNTQLPPNDNRASSTTEAEPEPPTAESLFGSEPATE